MLTKLIKFFYGIEGPMDEYRNSEINKLGNQALVVLICAQMLGILVTIVVDASALANKFGVDNILIAYLLFNFICISLAIAYLGWQVEKLQLADYDLTANELPKARQQLVKKTLRSGLIFTIGFYALNVFANWSEYSGAIINKFFAFGNICAALIGGVFYTCLVLIFSLHHLKNNEE